MLQIIAERQVIDPFKVRRRLLAPQTRPSTDVLCDTKVQNFMADSIVTITPAASSQQADSLLAQPSATLLFDDWYPALRSDQLRGTSMVTTTLLGHSRRFRP